MKRFDGFFQKKSHERDQILDVLVSFLICLQDLKYSMLLLGNKLGQSCTKLMQSLDIQGLSSSYV